jgi:hypothetical protein
MSCASSESHRDGRERGEGNIQLYTIYFTLQDGVTSEKVKRINC